ncbi:diguanylate cyclase (GGDEF)-like protein [Endobacter medicaginis]|uniref:diguanylate cyclase n=1 Tax=Endobacter medicaginis TaxID=1181271 RepID=A0A850NR68_9PROT|nr:diguanylate cyclase [Endobacter medicaginis]MBB3172311.1 diguanylate cyclase (GGDEF)-like protein [Endobacter medicaginis]MCX5474570.1 diguanylate cyclase [Endobacter medicaginis]NVN30346.1 diguanylate cyclase [Endobacter medicaginis]
MLGENQGIKGSPTFTYLAASADRRFIVGSQVGRLLVARDDGQQTYQRLKFLEVRSSTDQLVSFGIMTPYGAGMVVATQSRYAYLDLSDPKRPQLTGLPPELADADHVLHQASSILADGQTLWGTLPTGEICSTGAGGSRCWTARDGLPNERWGGLARTPSGQIIARSPYHMVWLDRSDNHVRRIVDLPDPAQVYSAPGAASQAVIVAPTGDLLTQTRHGIAMLRGDRWLRIDIAPSVGSLNISTLFRDRSGSLWVGVFAVGLMQYFNYDTTESWTTDSGLSSNVAWAIARDGDRTFIGTDGGLNLMVGRSEPRPWMESQSTQAVAVGRNDTLWACMSDGTLMRVDRLTGQSRRWTLPMLTNVHVATDGSVWIATGKGLYLIHDNSTSVTDPVLRSSPDLTITDLAVDPDGELWLTGNGALWNLGPNGKLVQTVSDWHEQGISPEIVRHSPDGPIWVGSMDGLFRVDLRGDGPVVTRVPDSLLPNSTIMAVLPHSNGDLWVGTTAGIAIERKGIWTTIDTNDGLIGNDVAADGIVEDVDHSVWVATSSGVTHILDPVAILRPHFPVVSLLSETVNGAPYDGALLPNAPARLDLMLGVFDNPYGGRIQYRTRMVGVDPDWIVQPTGSAIYPFLPSGHHDLLVEAYDPVRHIASEPLHVLVAMAEPWWRRPWAIVIAALLIAGLVWLALRWRTAYLVRQRHALAEQVSSRTRELELRTHELEEARQRLEVLAQRDALTGLLNRRAVRDLFDKHAGRKDASLSVALLDVDHFKRINDTHGHLGGDSVLVEIARRFERAFVGGEVIGRFGGEEYVVLLPGPPGLAPEALRRVVREVVDRPVFFGARVIRFTVSGGIADVLPSETWEQALSRADQALYEAKRAGRDLILEAHPALTPSPVAAAPLGF